MYPHFNGLWHILVQADRDMPSKSVRCWGHCRAGGEALCAEHIVAAALAGDSACAASLTRFEERLARALAGVINLLDPEVIVLGGGLSNIGRLYENVPRLWRSWVFSDQVDTRLLPSCHGDSSGVRGAAWLWPA